MALLFWAGYSLEQSHIIGPENVLWYIDTTKMLWIGCTGQKLTGINKITCCLYVFVPLRFWPKMEIFQSNLCSALISTILAIVKILEQCFVPSEYDCDTLKYVRVIYYRDNSYTCRFPFQAWYLYDAVVITHPSYFSLYYYVI